MAKLNQIIAIEKGIKSRVKSEVTELYKSAQKADLFNGFAKSYEKIDEEGEDLPPERKRVQLVAKDALVQANRLMTELFDVTARKDWTNCKATADITIDGKVLVPKAPVPFLLFLEKELTDVRTFVSHLPTLEESDDWSQDVNSGLFRTEPTKTHRTKKIVRPIVMYDATENHPAQTQLITEDVLAGYWSTTKQSGALPKPRKAQLLARVEQLLQAVKQAREEANGVDEATPVPTVGDALFEYLLAE